MRSICFLQRLDGFDPLAFDSENGRRALAALLQFVEHVIGLLQRVEGPVALEAERDGREGDDREAERPRQQVDGPLRALFRLFLAAPDPALAPIGHQWHPAGTQPPSLLGERFPAPRLVLRAARLDAPCLLELTRGLAVFARMLQRCAALEAAGGADDAALARATAGPLQEALRGRAVKPLAEGLSRLACRAGRGLSGRRCSPLVVEGQAVQGCGCVGARMFGKPGLPRRPADV